METIFVIIRINLCQNPPTLQQLSQIMGSSHQNVKQLLLKLQKKGFVRFMMDEKDKRKQRIILTEQCALLCQNNQSQSEKFVTKMFENVSKEALMTTIQTIIQIENHLMEGKEYD